jgi:GNAT superfamily N-acetyltransferase
VDDGSVQIIELDETWGDAVALLIARAFQDDPILVHACPNAEERARWLPWLFRWSTWQGLKFGRLLGTAGDLDGVAALVGPGGGPFTDEDFKRLRFDEAQEALGAAFWDQCGALVNAGAAPAEAALHRAVSQPYWYVDALAVTPERQGQGLGSALLRAAKACADADSLPLVLLTCQPRTLILNNRHGFEEVCEIDIPETNHQCRGMRRPPQD